MDEKLTCNKCYKPVEKDFFYCPHCGEPLSNITKEIENKKEAIAQLKLLTYLIGKVQDKTTLALLEKLVDKYEEGLK